MANIKERAIQHEQSFQALSNDYKFLVHPTNHIVGRKKPWGKKSFSFQARANVSTLFGRMPSVVA